MFSFGQSSLNTHEELEHSTKLDHINLVNKPLSTLKWQCLQYAHARNKNFTIINHSFFFRLLKLKCQTWRQWWQQSIQTGLYFHVAIFKCGATPLSDTRLLFFDVLTLSGSEYVALSYSLKYNEKFSMLASPTISAANAESFFFVVISSGDICAQLALNKAYAKFQQDEITKKKLDLRTSPRTAARKLTR